MNQTQKFFVLTLLSKTCNLLTLYFGFWAFIYEFAWWNKPLMFALMSSAITLVLFIVCFVSSIVLETWLRFPDAIPTFKLERKTRKTEKPKKKEEKKLPLF